MILAILFMGVFSFDVFEGEGAFGEKLVGFLMHNIPVLILTAILILAWKMELWGGLLIIIASLALMIWFHSFTTNKGSLIVMAPFLLSGILFIFSYTAGKRK
jgi:thiol:disulfide interchange protein